LKPDEYRLGAYRDRLGTAHWAAMARSKPNDADVVVVGAGIVGLATAHQLATGPTPRAVIVVDKEAGLARHQTGHNSGVIHSGLYYKPGSMKARTATTGRQLMVAFCAEHGVPHRTTGKVVVATRASQTGALEELYRRGIANGLAVRRISLDEMRELEPHARGVAALHVPETGVVDYVAVCEMLRSLIVANGGDIRLGWPVRRVTTLMEQVEVRGDGEILRAGHLVNCAGLHSDRVARLAGSTGDTRIMPFRGEYRGLRPDAAHLCRTLIYPVPDPNFPFLGVHFTRGVDDDVHVGPNAVPAFAREGYRWRAINGKDTLEILRARSSWKLARRYWRTGIGEILRSVSERAFVKALQELVPEVTAADLVPAAAGVRAQAIAADGALLDDFVVQRTERVVNIVNAPSPAATASLAIGAEVAAMVDPR
jgi:L-2-hydroxyglutarate oxidase